MIEPKYAEKQFNSLIRILQGPIESKKNEGIIMQVTKLAADYYVMNVSGAERYETIFYRASDDKVLGCDSSSSYIYIEVDNTKIEVSDRWNNYEHIFKRVSNETIDLKQLDSDIAGVWTGTYAHEDWIRNDKEGVFTKYIIPIEINKLACVVDYSDNWGDSGRILEVAYLDEENNTIRFRDLKEKMHDADFYGNLNASKSEIIGDSSWIFKLTKTGELEDLSSVLAE